MVMDDKRSEKLHAQKNTFTLSVDFLHSKCSEKQGVTGTSVKNTFRMYAECKNNVVIIFVNLLIYWLLTLLECRM